MDVPVFAKVALLQALLEGPGHGRKLVARLRDRTDKEIDLWQGSTYPALKSLAEEGYIVDSGNQIYELTPAGVARARHHRRTLQSLISGPDSGPEGHQVS